MDSTIKVVDQAAAQELVTKLEAKIGEGGGSASFSGTSTQLVLGDGTYVDIDTFITNNIEKIRTGIGVVTKSKNGLVPNLPS